MTDPARRAEGLRISALRRRVLAAVVVRDGPYCFWCGVVTSLENRHLLKTKNAPGKGYGKRRRTVRTLDHIVPRTAGGADTVENGLCACFNCNRSRGDMDASVFLFSLIRKAPLEWSGLPVVSRSAGGPLMQPNFPDAPKSSAESIGV